MCLSQKEDTLLDIQDDIVKCLKHAFKIFLGSST